MNTFLVVAGIAVAVCTAVMIARSRNALAGRDAHKIRCPHCQVRGAVTVRLARHRDGVGAPHADPAAIAAGASMLVTGLSGKQTVRHHSCSNCGMQWDAAW